MQGEMLAEAMEKQDNKIKKLERAVRDLKKRVAKLEEQMNTHSHRHTHGDGSGLK
jgi:chaperonin cofactor prefoldin